MNREIPTTDTEVSRESGVPLSDEEVICAFMEPKPTEEDRAAFSYFSFWTPRTTLGNPSQFEGWYPKRLTLDALHKVEERLTDEQRALYSWNASFPGGTTQEFMWSLLHCTSEKKIKVLAAVIRKVTP